MVYIIAIGAFQALLIMVLMLGTKHKQSVDHLICLLLLFIFVHLGIKFLIYNNLNNSIFKQGFTTFIDLAYGPLIWLIARKAKDAQFAVAKFTAHFIPSLLAAFCFLGIVIYTAVLGEAPVGFMELYNRITGYLLIPLLLGFSAAAFRVGMQNTTKALVTMGLSKAISVIFLVAAVIISSFMIYGAFIETSATTLSLVRTLFYSLLLLVCVVIMRYLASSRTLNSLKVDGLFVDKKTMVLDGAALISGAFNPQSFLNNPLLNKPFIKERSLEAKLGSATFIESDKDQLPDDEKTAGNKTENQKRSVLSIQEQKTIIDKLQKLMQEKKCFTNPEIDLPAISELTNISRHHLSEALNQYAGKTFYTFINEYRINEVLMAFDKCMANNIKPNILTIALGAGFNSKSSFNGYFKKHTGISPTEYLKSIHTACSVSV